jgi:hypothetical protein
MASRSVSVRVCAIVFVFVGARNSWAQAAADPADHSQHQMSMMGNDSGAMDASPLGLPMGREGSGTAWLPDDSPMYAVHGRIGSWQTMVHGNAFAEYLFDSGERGTKEFGSINWLMGMAEHGAAGGRFGVRGMLSLEPWTIRGCGYPDLLASGEVCQGHAIVDQQHPHDLFMEIAAHYERAISDSVAFQIYGGPAAEPALGPVAYPHRVSAMANPLAPIAHHWLDATHITFGVITGAVYGRKWKTEGSLFNGREPDENRRNFDFAPLDSVSGRVWWLPTTRVAVQVSAGHLKDAEPGHTAAARVTVDRVTASATYHRMFESSSSLSATTVAWGRNAHDGEISNFVLAETNLTFHDRATWFGRVEAGQKSADDLDIHNGQDLFTIAKLQAGYVRYFAGWHAVKAGLGGSASVGVVPATLSTVYGRRANAGFGLFVTIRPVAMAMAMGGMNMAPGQKMP